MNISTIATSANMDEELFSRVYTKRFDMLVFQASQYLYDKDEAQDVAAEAFAILWCRRFSFGSEAKMVAFLQTVIRNACISIIRKKKLHRKHEGTLVHHFSFVLEEDFVHPETRFTRSDLWSDVLANIEKLPERKRQVLQLAAKGHSTTDIATMLSIATQTVRNQRNSGVKTLRSKSGLG